MIQAAMLVAVLAVQPAAAQERTGTITGTIRSVNGDLAPGMQVMAVMDGLLPANSGPSISVITNTGADGRYRFTGLPPGAYYIVAGSLETPTYFPGVRGQSAARLLLAPADRALADVNFALAPAPSVDRIAPILVSGHVTVEGGTPLPIQVETPPGAPGPRTWFRLDVRPAERLQGDRPQPRYAEVHADGAFRFEVEPGSYTVSMGRLLLGYYVKSLTAGGIDLLREPLTLRPNVAPPGLSVTLTRTPPSGLQEMKVSGRVVVKGGEVLPQWVRLDGLSPCWPNLEPGTQVRLGEAPVREDGTFEFTHVPAGLVTVQALQSSMGPRNLNISDADAHVELNAGFDPLTSTPLVGRYDPFCLATTLQGFRPRSLGFEYRESQPIRGIVMGEMPLPKRIWLTLVDSLCSCLFGGPDVEAEIDSSGRFSFPGLLPGLYKVQVSLPILVSLPLPGVRVRTWPGPNDVEIRLPAIRNIPGRLVVEGGRPAPDEVRVNIQGGIAAAAQPDGRFTLPLAEGGHYALFLTGLPQGYDVRSILQAGRDLQREALKVGEGADPTEIVVTLTATTGQ